MSDFDIYVPLIPVKSINVKCRLLGLKEQEILKQTINRIGRKNTDLGQRL